MKLADVNVDSAGAAGATLEHERSMPAVVGDMAAVSDGPRMPDGAVCASGGAANRTGCSASDGTADLGAAGSGDAPPQRWVLMLSALAGDLQPLEPQAPGPSRRVKERQHQGPHVPELGLRWRDTDRHASAHRRVLGFR